MKTLFDVPVVIQVAATALVKYDFALADVTFEFSREGDLQEVTFEIGGYPTPVKFDAKGNSIRVD